MKVYTKTGDKGETSLFGNKRVSKDHYRVEAYGTIDELSSHIGVLVAEDLDVSIKKDLKNIQRKLFVLSSRLAAVDDQMLSKVEEITKEDIHLLENRIDTYLKDLPDINRFVIPGGQRAVGCCHVCRTICRRAERRIITIQNEEQIEQILIEYVNRLSDYFYVLSKKIAKDVGFQEDIA